MPRLTFLFCIFLLHMIIDSNVVIAQDKLMVHADEMPYFSGCNEFESKSEEKRQCSNYNLVSFIASHLQYPEEAKKQGLEGTVILSFVITKEGKVHQPYVLKDIGGRYRIMWGNIKGKTITKKEIKTNLLESITVRGPYGEDIAATEVVIAYERKNKFLNAVGQNKVNKAQEKLLKKAKNKGIITISVTIQIKGEFVEVDREFEVVKNK